MLTFAESKHPVFRSTSPVSRGLLKSKGDGKLSRHSCSDPGTIETVFCKLISVHQLSISGAVSDWCDECDTCHDRTGRLVVEGQSNPLFVRSVMKTHIPLTDDPAQQEEDLLQRYKERIEKLSQQDRVTKFCTDAGFLTKVEVGQYFMTKDTEEFSHFTDSVACREYTFPRYESFSEPKGWIRVNTNIGPVLEVTTCCLQSKCGGEIRVESVNKDHSHSWVRISRGLNRLATNLNDNEQETSEGEVRRLCVENECTCFCEPIKGKSKTTKTYFCQLIPKKLYLLGERTWTDIEPQDYSLTDYSVSKKPINLLLHGEKPRDDGSIEFWRLKDFLQHHFVHSRNWV